SRPRCKALRVIRSRHISEFSQRAAAHSASLHYLFLFGSLFLTLKLELSCENRASLPLRSIIDHRASAAQHCSKTPASPHRTVWRLLRPGPQRASGGRTRRTSPVHFRQNPFPPRQPPATQIKTAPRAVSAPLRHG